MRLGEAGEEEEAEATEEARGEQAAGHTLEEVYAFGATVAGVENDDFRLAPARSVSGSLPSTLDAVAELDFVSFRPNANRDYTLDGFGFPPTVKREALTATLATTLAAAAEERKPAPTPRDSYSRDNSNNTTSNSNSNNDVRRAGG